MPDPLFHRWIKVTFAGWCLGFALVLALLALASALGLGDTKFPIGLGMGVGVGLAQRTVVRDYLGARTPWAVLSALGVTLPFLALDLATRLDFHVPIGIALPACVVIAGLAAGLAQYIILRRHGAGSLLWLPLSGLGWTLAAGTVVFNDRLLPRIPGILGALLFVAVLLLGGLFLGLATAVGLRARRDPPTPVTA